MHLLFSQFQLFLTFSSSTSSRQRKTVKQLDSERQTDRQSDGQKQTNTAGSTDIHYWDKEREIKGKTTKKTPNATLIGFLE